MEIKKMPEEKQRISLRERNKLRTRQEIQSAALEVFQEAGFVGSSVDKIAKVAGTSKGTIYVYFPDGLDDIYREIYVNLSDKLLVAGQEKRDACSDPIQRILALAEALLELSAQSEFGRFYNLLSPAMRPVLAPVLGRASKEFIVLISADIEAVYSDEKVEPRIFAELFTGAIREAAKIVSETPRSKGALLEGLEALISGLQTSSKK
ncbi:MAG: TetR/AcrR family transcriptional regulator [Pirellulales bacterium]|nr:TetR/AcrR family transcriptional regulator [Pirellulales bacterium]